MDFEFNEEQQLLADSVSKYLASHYDFEARKKLIASPTGYSQPAWSMLSEMGLTAIPFATEAGGFGGGAVDMMAAMEAFGEALVIEPLLDHVALASRLVAKLGSPAQQAAHLPALLDGSCKATLAYLERGRRYALNAAITTAEASSAGWTLNGEKVVVIGAPLADVLIVSAKTGNAASGSTQLFYVDAKAQGVSISSYLTVDGQRAGTVALVNVKLAADALLGSAPAPASATAALPADALGAVEEAVDFATALACADAVGAMKYACDATLEYLKTRKQFGNPIGAFQALQHRMVDMFMACEQSRSMAIMAACRVDAATGADAASVAARKKAVSSAKVFIADAARLVSQEAVQLHGGMGMTEELKISHTFRRLTVLAQRFGDADHHLARYSASH